MRLLSRVGSERISPSDGLSARLRAASAALILLLCFPALSARGADEKPSAASDALDVAVGIEGVWKIGHVTPIRVGLPAAIAATAASIEVATVDGDGVAVTYVQRLEPRGDSASSDAYWCSATIGRGDHPLSVRVSDAAGKRLAERELDGSELGQALPPTQPWIVALGSSLGVEATSHSLASSELPSFSTTVVTDPRALPDSWNGLSGCDVLIIATSNPSSSSRGGSADAGAGSVPLVSELAESQWRGIEDWISHGGAAVVSLGAYADKLAEDSPLRELLPGRIVERPSKVSTSPLEASTATNVQLAPITAARLDDVRGAVELSLIDSTGKRFPWWVRYSIGKGVVHYIGSDLDEPVLREWKDRRLVWDQILSKLWTREQQSDVAAAERSISGTAYLGYDDLIGQLRATLDNFPAARIYSFGEITFLLAVLLLIIGPLDYWISVRWLRRPDFSWYLGGTVLALASAGLIWSESVARPKELLLNSAQVIDFLPEQERALAESWTHVYSSRARTIDCTLRASSPVLDQRLDWQGLPGKGLGGMESNLLSDQGMPAYTITVPAPARPRPQEEAEAGEGESSDETSDRAAIRGIGIAASGTKCLYATWSEPFHPQGTSKLRELRGIDQIEGLLVNPLSQDLLRPVLMYHNWVYQLPSRLRAGEELTLTYDMVPKDLMRRLNRRQVVNNTDQITPWVPDDRQSLDRLLEIMMFYKASGGASYAHLQHRFQPRTDISNALDLDHAVLFGQLDQPLGGVTVEGLGPDQVQQTVNRIWCRVLLPVARSEE